MQMGGLFDHVDEGKIKYENILAIVYIIVALVLDIASCVTLIVYRKRYPILERSPTLTVAASNFLLISTLPFPLWVMLKYYDIKGLSIKQCQENIILIALTSYVLFFTMTTAKVWRILYVVYNNNPRRFYRFLGNELMMFLILSGLVTPLSLFGFYIYFLFADVSEDQQLDYFIAIQLILWNIFSLSMIFFAFFMRKLHYKLRFTRECILLCIYNLVLSALPALYIEKFEDTFLYQFILMGVYYFTFLVLVFWLPLLQSQLYHEMLPRRILLSKLRFLAQDQGALQRFDQYLTFLDSVENSRSETYRKWYTLRQIQKQVNRKITEEGDSIKEENEFFDLIQKFKPERVAQRLAFSAQSQQSNKSDGTLNESFFYRNLLTFYLSCLQEYLTNEKELRLEHCLQVLNEYFLGEGLLNNPNSTFVAEKPVLKRYHSSPTKLSDSQSQSRKQTCDPTLIKKVQQMINCSENELIIQLVSQYFFLVEDYLEYLFQFNYKQTVSYRHLEKLFEEYERITKNLFIMGMTCTTMQESTAYTEETIEM